MTFKCPFQHKRFYDYMTVLQLAKSHKIRDTKQILSNTVHLFEKNCCFLQPQFTGNKKKIQKSVSLQNKARTNLLSTPISITESIRSLKAAPVISLVSSSLPPMQIFNYIILDTVLPRSQSSPQQVLPKLILKYTLWGKAGKGISSTWRGMHRVLHACMLIVVKSWSSGHKQVNWETQWQYAEDQLFARLEKTNRSANTHCPIGPQCSNTKTFKLCRKTGRALFYTAGRKEKLLFKCIVALQLNIQLHGISQRHYFQEK